jgi:proteasome activator subunit 4
LGEKKPNEFL